MPNRAKIPLKRISIAMSIATKRVTTQHIHLLPQLLVIFAPNRLHTSNMLPLCVRKCLDLRQNINTLNSQLKAR